MAACCRSPASARVSGNAALPEIAQGDSARRRIRLSSKAGMAVPPAETPRNPPSTTLSVEDAVGPVSPIRAGSRRRLRRDGEQFPLVGHALELVQSATGEREV
jgi:hypothetical protein